MAKVGFTCPDGVNIKAEECYKKCRLGERCATLPTLRKSMEQREWNGLVSTTTALKGTLEAFLIFTTDYYESIDSCAFRMLGTMHHKLLEDFASDSELAEESFKDELNTGIADLVTASETKEGFYDLTDYKTSGSYVVRLALGYYTEDEPVIDDAGNQVVFKSGARKGQVKTKKVQKQSDEKKDMKDWSMQLSRYAMFYEKAGFPIDKMRVQVTVRDGGCYIAKGRNVDRNIYVLDVPRIPDEAVMDYYMTKSEALITAMETGVCDSVCSQEERWDNDRKCEAFCSARYNCPFGVAVMARKQEEKGDK